MNGYRKKHCIYFGFLLSIVRNKEITNIVQLIMIIGHRHKRMKHYIKSKTIVTVTYLFLSVVVTQSKGTMIDTCGTPFANLKIPVFMPDQLAKINFYNNYII